MRNSFKKIVFFITLLGLIFFPILGEVNAYEFSLAEVRAIISDSAPSASEVEYVFQFTTGIVLTSNQRINITFPEDYDLPVAGSADVLCPPNMTASVNLRIITCTVNIGQTHPATATEIIIFNIENPEKKAAEGIADIYSFLIETDNNEGANPVIAIVEPFKVRAVINPILNFEVEGVGSGENIHSFLTGVTTTPVFIPFGLIEPDVSVLAAQDLFVVTNAAYGFTVNIFQDGNLRRVEGDEIYCFINSQCVNYMNSTSWVSPMGYLGVPETYGHFGITSEDESLGNDCDENYYDFEGINNWAGLEGITQAEVMRHCEPADGQARHAGTTRIGFQVEISILQPAGEYESILTYIVTPTF